MTRHRVIPALVAAALIVSMFWPARGHAEPPLNVPILVEDVAALNAATSAVCNKQVVLLGEALHGNGHGDAFKAAMVARLVERCGFRAVLFEASFYEFVPIWRVQRERRSVLPEQIGTAVGGLWKFNREIEPLLRFLAARSNKGLFLGGIDFQVGGLQQDYTNSAMISELTQGLPAAEIENCRDLFNARLQKGLNQEQRFLAARCVAQIALKIRADKSAVAQDQRLMLHNLAAIFHADFAKGEGDFFAARDYQMFENIKLLQKQIKPQHKIIIWTANAHAAKSVDEISGLSGVRNLGNYVAEAFGARSYALGTTAFSGTIRWGRGKQVLPEAPLGSLEAEVMAQAGPNSAFLGQSALQQRGRIAAGPFSYKFVAADWSRRFDGLVIFREERAAFSTRFGN